MKRLLLVLLLCASNQLSAQTAVSKSLTTNTCTSATSAGCLVLGQSGRGTTTIQITGTFVGTLQFEQTVDGTTWATWPLLPNGVTTTVTSATAIGFWTGAITAQQARIRFSAYTSGTAAVSAISIDSRAAAIPASGGTGTPGGSSGQLQYNNAGAFGGLSKWTVDAGQMMTSTATGIYFKNQPTENTSGAFGQVIGVASNSPDTKPDHTMIIGWNVDGAVSGAGSNGLSFESYCSLGTGCLAGAGGQSETYFSMDDGKGNPGVRPLGFFQRKNDNNTPYIYTIARSDQWSFWDAPFENPLFVLNANRQHVLSGSLTQALTGSWLIQAGTSLIEKGSGVGGVSVAPSGGLDLGSNGEYITNIQTNHIRTASTNIEDATGHVRITLGGGDDAEHLAMQNSPGSVLLKPLGTATNIDLELNSKGTGFVVLNPAAGGGLKISGLAGITASGTSCTITTITKGIITAATCTP